MYFPSRAVTSKIAGALLVTGTHQELTKGNRRLASKTRTGVQLGTEMIGTGTSVEPGVETRAGTAKENGIETEIGIEIGTRGAGKGEGTDHRRGQGVDACLGFSGCISKIIEIQCCTRVSCGHCSP